MGKRQCDLEGCTKLAASGGTPCCKAHGGGKHCQHAGCSKSARGDTGQCVGHGGGKWCQHESCLKGAEGGTHLHRTRRGQALPARGLPQVCCYRRHALSAGHTAAARRCGGAVTLRTRPGTQLA
jgi:hypothetical protein